MQSILINKSFWTNKKVLITGHTGFKGSWLSILLKNLGANVSGIALKPVDRNSLFEKAGVKNLIDDNFFQDIRDGKVLKDIVMSIKPQIIFHLAAQPFVRDSYVKPIETWETNVIGTLNILNATMKTDQKVSVICITTDKVYENKEWLYGYRENDMLGGNDPYSSSKAAAELAISSWRKSFCGLSNHQNSNIGIASARAGNVIGGGDWGKDRLIPDLIKSKYENKNLIIRNPYAKRPWQHVLDPLSGYLRIAEFMFKSENFSNNKFCSAFNIGPTIESNKTVIELLKEVDINLQIKWDIENNFKNYHEAKLLHLNTDKANNELNWFPIWNFEKSISATILWYKRFYEENINAYQLCLDDIGDFVNFI